MKFVGRQKELQCLLDIYNSQGQKNVLLYGKRRVGKTQLILQSLKEYRGTIIFFQALESSFQVNISNLSNSIGNALKKDYLHFTSINEVMSFLSSEAKEKDIVLVLDEYQFLKKCIPEIDGLFQFYIDHNKTDNLKIIFCGSYAGIMKSLDSNKEPLFGRFDKHIVLKELSFYDAIKLCPDSYSIEEKIKIYSIFSGIPYYYNFLNSDLTANENIIQNVMDNNSPLAKECEFILKNELTQINWANDIFQAISIGKVNFKDIKDYLGISNPNTINYPLTQLMEMELIQKIRPINTPSIRKTFYSISDNFYSFYYRYVYPNLSKISLFGAKDIFNSIQSDFETKYIPHVFEKISKQFIVYKNDQHYFNPPINDLGTYIYNNPKEKRNGEFDIVCFDLEKKYIFFEVKYSVNKVNLSDIYHLKEQVALTNSGNCRYGFISKSGYEQDAIKYMEENHWYHFDINDVMFKN